MSKRTSNLNTRLDKRAGITLIELLAYIAVLSIVLGGMVFFVINIVRNERRLTDILMLTDEMEFAMRQVVDTARLSKKIVLDTASANPSRFTNTLPPTCSTNCVLSLEQTDTSDPAKTNNVKFWVNGDGVLVVTKELSSGGTKVLELTTGRVVVEEFSVKCLGVADPQTGNVCENSAGAVQINMEVSNAADSGEKESIQTSVTPRGY